MISVIEIVDIFIMTAFLAYLFEDYVKPRSSADIVSMLDRGVTGNALKKRKAWEDLKFAALVIAPGVILHELAHKFVAIGFGHQATFQAFYQDPFTLMLGVIAILSKVLNWGFIFIVPGFVSISAGATALQTGIIAFAGPLIHALFWAGSKVALDTNAVENRAFWAMTRRINGFLFVFNLLPIPGFDGHKVLLSMLSFL